MSITMWTELAVHGERELEAFDGVYIGGGNTFSLLAELQESGFDRFLTAYAVRENPVYGGSAGAAILGVDIRTVAHMDSNHVGLQDTSGLNLAYGHSVWPHYKPKDDEFIRSFIAHHGFPVLAISERSGIAIEGEELRGAGSEPAWRFDEHDRTEL